METRQLEYFVAAAEELNFTRAASRLFTVQSTVSAAIASLEADLGTALFNRSTKRVALTPAGELLVPRARAAIEAIEVVRNTATESSAGIRGRLRVGIFTNIAAIDLPEVFGRFHEQHPLVDLQLGASASGSTGLADDVRRGRIDVAFMGLPQQDLAGFSVLTLATTRYVVVLPQGHPLSDRASLTLRDVADEKFVDSPAGYGNRVVIERAFARAGLTRTVATQVGDLGDIPRFVAAKLGIGIVPHGMLSFPTTTTVVPLVDPEVAWRLSVISRPAASAPVAAFLGLLAGEFPHPDGLPVTPPR